MDSSAMTIAKAILELECSEDVKNALRELFTMELGTVGRPTKKQYLDVIEKYADKIEGEK